MNLLSWIALVIVILAAISEAYRMNFERQSESKDERGQMLLLQLKSVSHSVLTGGIFIGFVLVAILKVMKPEIFVFYVLFLLGVQSIASSVYLSRMRKL